MNTSNSTALTKEVLDELALNKLDKGRQEKILSLKETIDPSNEQSILKFGGAASKRVHEINANILSSIKVRDIPEIESILPELNNAFKEVDSGTLLQKKQGFFNKLFRGDPVKDFMQKFENAEGVVADIQKNLQSVEMELRKDMALEDALGMKNLQYIGELDDCLFAIGLKLNEETAKLEEEERNVDKDDIVSLQILEQHKDEVDGLSKQQYWLAQQRLVAIQTLPILRNLKNNNKDMIRQINLTVQQSIPAWEQGIIIAFHIHRQQGAIRIERAVHDMTNNIIKQNSLMLKENSAEIAKAVESGMIDIETFREANKNLLETSRKISEIKSQAIKSRQENMIEYQKLATELLEAEKRNMSSLINTTTAGELNG